MALSLLLTSCFSYVGCLSSTGHSHDDCGNHVTPRGINAQDAASTAVQCTTLQSQDTFCDFDLCAGLSKLNESSVLFLPSAEGRKKTGGLSTAISSRQTRSLKHEIRLGQAGASRDRGIDPRIPPGKEPSRVLRRRRRQSMTRSLSLVIFKVLIKKLILNAKIYLAL